MFGVSVVAILMLLISANNAAASGPPATCPGDNGWPELAGQFWTDPSEGVAGTKFHLKGSGAQPNIDLQLTWGQVIHSVSLGTVYADANGTLDYEFTVPDSLPGLPEPIRPGPHTLLLYKEFVGTACVDFYVTEGDSVGGDGYSLASEKVSSPALLPETGTNLLLLPVLAMVAAVMLTGIRKLF